MSLILSGTDGLSDVDGSAATPAIRGTDANTGIFFPAADTIAFAEGGAEVARFDSSGNFCLGTAAVLTSGKLSLQADLSAVNAMTIRDSGTSYGVSSYYTLYQNSAGSTVGGIGHTAVTSLGINAITDLQFSTANTERMRLDASGNLGIGTSSPAYKLDVTGPGTANGSTLRLNDSASGANSKHLLLQRSSSTATIGLAGALANDPLWLSRSGGYDVLIDSSGNLMAGTTTTDYKFRVNGTSHFGDGYDNGVYGQVAITRPANQGAQFHLAFVRQGTQVSGMGFLNNSSTFAIQNASTNAGSGVTLAVNGTSWGTTSDERTKDILGGVDNALQKLSNWRTVYFKYKTDAEAQTQRVGLIAQDVQATLPEAVSIEEDEIKTLQLRYTEVIPVLVKAIQEQQALIQTLTARISALESA
jgi:uncharacterized protein YaiE (UPF0345 family)